MDTITKAVTRASAVLGSVPADRWASTTDITIHLEQRGFTWGSDTTRGVLNHLRDTGTLLRRTVGRSYEWRVAQNLGAQAEWRVAGGEQLHGMPTGDAEAREAYIDRTLAAAGVTRATHMVKFDGTVLRRDDLAGRLKPSVRPAAEILDELRESIEAAQVPADHVATDVFIGNRAALGTLVTASHDITTRAIERAQVVALREVLNSLAGWIEVGRENCASMHTGRNFEECCGRIEQGDVRGMVEGAANVLGIDMEAIDATS